VKPIRIGCSGWNYQSWRGGEFYPKGCPPSRWLEHYSRVFDTVEVNSTFYRLASQKAVAHWIEQTPPHFVFALKASRYLTHIKRLANLEQGIARYYERIEPLTKAHEKLGPIVWQLPPNFQRDEERLESALAALPEGRHCFEFRHKSWFTDDVYALLRAYGAALVIGDRKGLDFQTYEMTADWTLVRFHHGHRGRRGNYSDSELEEWAQRFEDWSREVEIHAYFNNDWEVFAPRNARWMRRRLGV
jgi:uncharacterized protein YecE (DUF72 family)